LLIGFNPILSPTFILFFIFMILIAILFTAFGTAIGSILEDMHAFPLIINFLIMPLFFLSGALFPLKNLPRAIDIVASLNPLSYGVDGIRGALVGQMHFSLTTDLIVLLIFNIVVLGIGSYSFSKIKG
ncbi:MAG: ABC transporter permease, partial [Patescibacteria group bacterium]